RHEDRGEFAGGRVAAPRAEEASMRPRHEDRGEYHLLAPIRLPVAEPSMRPRHEDRGESGKLGKGQDCYKPFNAATAGRPWRITQEYQSGGNTGTFNAATARRPWRIPRTRNSKSRYRALFGRCGQERLPQGRHPPRVRVALAEAVAGGEAAGGCFAPFGPRLRRGVPKSRRLAVQPSIPHSPPVWQPRCGRPSPRPAVVA